MFDRTGYTKYNKNAHLWPIGCKVPSLEMRSISWLLRLSLLPEMGQRARIFMSKTT